MSAHRCVYTCICVHVCVYLYNISSHHGVVAHVGAVRGVCVDGLNQRVFSVGADRLLKTWRFKTRRHDADPLHLDSPPSLLHLHRDR